MGCTRAELLQRISAKELQEWIAYSIVEPFGEERMDWHFATLIHAVLQPHLKKDSKLSVKDCLLKFGKERKQSAGEVLAIIEAMKMRQG